MRSRFPHVFVAFAACVAACAPSTFDNLTGAKAKENPNVHDLDSSKPDDSLRDRDPRPLAPFSTAWVNTAHPRFRWQNQDGVPGATLELARTRDFKGAKRIVATGSDYTVKDEDGIDAGIWFWRLQARSGDRFGPTYGPTWELLVRGRGPNGESDAAHGGFVDLNADGIPDLIVSMRAKFADEEAPTQKLEETIVLQVLGAKARDGAEYDIYDETRTLWGDCEDAEASLIGGIDVNGDGYGDLYLADIWPIEPGYEPEPEPVLEAWFGGEKGYAESEHLFARVDVQPFTKIPALAVGDFDGDGYGDISAALSDFAFTIRGSTHGPSTLLPFASAIGSGATYTSAIGGSDLDGDGRSDLAFAPFDPISPLAIEHGGPTRFVSGATLNPAGLNAAGENFKLPTRATAIVTGDFDGDGLDEVAFSTTVDGKAAVCIHSTSTSALVENACWKSDAPLAGFGERLLAGDLDADGIDDIIVASATGLTILTHKGKGFAEKDAFTATPFLTTKEYTSTKLTMIDPGRPTKALWAMYGTDGKTLTVYRGLEVAKTIDVSTVQQLRQIEFLRLGSILR